MDYVLKTKDVTKVYGEHKAVHGVSMHVKKVQSMALLVKMELERPHLCEWLQDLQHQQRELLNYLVQVIWKIREKEWEV